MTLTGLTFMPFNLVILRFPGCTFACYMTSW